MLHKNTALTILCKKPCFYKTKSRISKTEGNKFAYEFANSCLEDTIGNVSVSKHYDTFFAVDSRQDARYFEEKYNVKCILTDSPSKTGKGLSQKMNNIFKNLGEKYEKTILIPMDTPYVKEDQILASIKRLDEKKVIIGPEKNGGVYLIGLNGYEPGVFNGVRWSTDSSCKDLVENFKRKNVFLLDTKNDFNTIKDVYNNLELIMSDCPSTFRLLNREGYFGQYPNFDDFNINVPVATAIVERETEKGIEVLMQVRNKPKIDKDNTGKLELIQGMINRKERAYDAVIREVFEETGLNVKIKSELNSSYKPFSISQQTGNGRAYLGINYLCEYFGGSLKSNSKESKNPRWVSLNNLAKILKYNPKKIFAFNLPTMREYLNFRQKLFKVTGAQS